MEAMWDILVSQNVKAKNLPEEENAVNLSGDSGYISEPEECLETKTDRLMEGCEKEGFSETCSYILDTETGTVTDEEEERSSEIEKGEVKSTKFEIPTFLIPPFEPFEEPLASSESIHSDLDKQYHTPESGEESEPENDSA